MTKKPWRRRLAAALALLGILLGAQRLGWDRLTRGAGVAVDALAQGSRLVLSLGWLLLLLAAVRVAVDGYRARRAVRRWLRSRLTTRPVRWGAAAAGLLAVLVLVVVVLPPHFTASHRFDRASDELKAQNDVRTTLLQALAGGVLLLGAYLTYRQLHVTREGQLTDRYTKAVDQLGSEHLDVRLGGIYALERIARDSPPDRATIEEVLTAYVRDHAPWPAPSDRPSLGSITQRLITVAQRRRSAAQRRKAHDRFGRDQQSGPDEERAQPPRPAGDGEPTITVVVKDTAGQDQQGGPDADGAESPRPAADVQAAITVLGRRQLPPGGLRPLDLTRANLQGAEFDHGNFRGAGFDYANLEGARLTHANLVRARLTHANVQGARLTHAKLGSARLTDADLQGAELAVADLGWAQLDRANLKDAELRGARLRGANLKGAELRGANLQGVDLLHANFQGARLAGANLRGAPSLEVTDLPVDQLAEAKLQDAQFLESAYLEGAIASRTTRWPADWTSKRAKDHGVVWED